ncbi:MAG TPA: hypothetical protein VF169_03710 [Albitalea sp.]|uniref:hypothetical protein n=1 Tax=Piscinibacter sp. TaxID=1903157 RepID=UPI002ED28B2C
MSKFPTSLNSGEPSQPADTRVGETHPEAPEEQRSDHRGIGSRPQQPPKAEDNDEPETPPLPSDRGGPDAVR